MMKFALDGAIQSSCLIDNDRNVCSCSHRKTISRTGRGDKEDVDNQFFALYGGYKFSLRVIHNQLF